MNSDSFSLFPPEAKNEFQPSNISQHSQSQGIAESELETGKGKENWTWLKKKVESFFSELGSQEQDLEREGQTRFKRKREDTGFDLEFGSPEGENQLPGELLPYHSHPHGGQEDGRIDRVGSEGSWDEDFQRLENEEDILNTVEQQRSEIFSHFHQSLQSSDGLLDASLWKLYLGFVQKQILFLQSSQGRQHLKQVVSLIREGGLNVHCYSWKIARLSLLIDSSLSEIAQSDQPSEIQEIPILPLSHKQSLQYIGYHPKSTEIWISAIQNSLWKKEFNEALNLSEAFSLFALENRKKILPLLENQLLPCYPVPSSEQTLASEIVQRINNNTFSVSCNSNYKQKLLRQSSMPPNQLIKELYDLFIREIQSYHMFSKSLKKPRFFSTTFVGSA